MIRNEENETEHAKSYEKIERLKQLKLSYKENLDILKKVGEVSNFAHFIAVHSVSFLRFSL